MRNVFKVVDKTLEVACVLLLFIDVALTAGQVFWRYVLNDPLTWSEEAARLAFIYLTFLAAAVAIRRRRAIRITVLVELLSTRWRHALDLFTHTLILIFLGIIIVQSKVLIDGIGYHEAPATGIQQSVFYLSLPIASVAMIFYMLEQMYEAYTGFRDNRPIIDPHRVVEAVVETEHAPEPVTLATERGR